MNRKTRQLVGMVTLILGLMVYVGAVVTIATTWLPHHWAIQAVFFGLAGILWAVPLKPLLAWMEAAKD